MSTYQNSFQLIPDDQINTVCDKIVERVTIDANDCWIWNGALFTSGYGKIKVARKSLYMHRVSSYLFHDTFDPDLNVCHECPNAHNKACINPWHLKQGTQAENMGNPLTRALIRQRVLEAMERKLLS